MIRLGDGTLRELLPPHLAEDSGMAAVVSALEPHLHTLARSIPNLLLYGRLAGQPAATMLPPLRRLTETRGGLKPLSEAELELLAWQFHVDFREVARSPEQLAAMVRQSIPWHRIKGTPASIKAALALFGISASIEESGRHWADYQLGLGGADDLGTVATAVRVAAEMAPVRCRLYRVYNDEFDRRPIVLSEGPALSCGQLSYFSGVSVPGAGDALVSIGKRLSGFSPAHVHAGLFGWLELHTLLARRLNRFIVGLSRLSDVYSTSKPFIFTNLFSLGAEHERVSRGFGTGHQAKAQAVPTEGFDVLGGSNFRLGTTWIEFPGTRFGVGLSALSGEDGQSRRIRVDELLAATSGFTAARGTRPEPVGFAWDVTDQFVARRMTRFVLGLSRLSDVYIKNQPFLFDSLLSIGAEHERLSRGFGARRQAKAQAVLSEGFDVLGGSNFRLGTTWIELPGTPFGVGLSALSGEDGQSRRVRVDEVLKETESLATEPRKHPDSGVGGLAFEVALRAEERRPRMRWTHEPWAHRRWWERTTFVNLNQEEETL